VENTVYFFIFVVASITDGARAADTASDLAVIVNKSCKLDEVGTADLVKYFTADKTKLPDGTKLTNRDARPREGGTQSGARGHLSNERKRLQRALRRGHLHRRVAMAPKSLALPAAVKKFVAETPGAISYVRSEESR